MKKLLKLALTAGAGAAIAYLFDPDRGKSRRARLTDQTAATARDMGAKAKQNLEYQTGVVQGVAHEATRPLRDEETFDDATLLQKVRSEALGRTSTPSTLEVDVTDGEVTLRGAFTSDEQRETLVGLIERIDGVRAVSDLTNR